MSYSVTSARHHAAPVTRTYATRAKAMAAYHAKRRAHKSGKSRLRLLRVAGPDGFINGFYTIMVGGRR